MMIRRCYAKICKYVLPFAMILTFLLGMTACSDTVLHEDHDQGAEGLISTPSEAIDYRLTFDGKTCLADRGGAVAKDGDNVVIIKAGVYHLTGSYEGQLQISVADTEHVTLIMEDLSITSPDSAALYVKNAGCVYVEVPEGKSATLTDAAEYVFPVGVTKPNACIYAADDITFRGLGHLTVNANYNNGIGCNNDVAFMSGRVTVSAKNNGVKGAGSVSLSGNSILTVLGADDAIKSDGINPDEGIIRMSEKAKVYASCSDDALQALTEITVTDEACIYYECEGSIVNCSNAKVPETAKIPWVKE
ncbi:MAG: carbohydrate-binding domain-containing protein [Clostridia bacterium]|nr:carbohydrate-binding domain-containing protein [Clostridia bacterium]